MTDYSNTHHTHNIHAIKCFFMVLMIVSGHAQSENHPSFTPPHPYSLSRYEASWEKNPFTLKTTPAVEQRAPFAEHLVIASVYGNLADPTVVLANVNTHERIRLQTSRANGSNIQLVRLHRGNGKRDDMLAIVSMGAETSEIRYGTDYLKQVSASGSARPAQSVLQKRQQSLSQHSGGAAQPPPSTPPKLAGGSALATGSLTGAARQQEGWLVAGSFNQSTGSGSHSSQTGSSQSDNHTSTPSVAEGSSGAAYLSLRRYTFRAGDEFPIPNPDPQ